MIATFTTVDLGVVEWQRRESETGGGEAKRWFRASPSSRYAGGWLFKPRRTKELELAEHRRARGDTPDILIGGQDWAEKIVAELAALVGVPAVDTELATVFRHHDNTQLFGSMSRDMRPKGWSWAPGASLLAERNDDFDEQTCVGHTVEAVHAALADVAGPYNSSYADWSAYDVFAGYLMLDAWVANTDRHANNWGVMQDPATGDMYLGPSFDHGTSLASGETVSKRAQRVRDQSVDHWCANGQTKRFYGGKRTSLVKIAERALAVASEEARQHWIKQITAVDVGLCNDVVEAIPRMSDPDRKFVQSVIATNRKRICDALH